MFKKKFQANPKRDLLLKLFTFKFPPLATLSLALYPTFFPPLLMQDAMKMSLSLRTIKPKTPRTIKPKTPRTINPEQFFSLWIRCRGSDIQSRIFLD